MAIDLHNQAALIDAVTVGAERPVAFLVGSPLSWDKDGGVPGVEDMLTIAKTVLQSKLPHRVPDFEIAVRGLGGAEAYQAAMKWLHGSLTQAGVNEVIRQAVLKARLASSETVFQGDGNPADWYLPAGARGLAALIAADANRFTGPLLTTNFDPLISLSLLNTGLRRRLRVIDSDGALPIAVEADPGEIDVVHLHGYWHGANTLHTPAQLTSPRPKLNASLRRLLQQRTLVVIAYSGWDDVFTRALADILQDAEAQVTVLWCFREADSATIEHRYANLLTRVQPAITSGALHLYGGVDCHSVFAEMAKIRKIYNPGSTEAMGINSVLPGWQAVSSSYLSSLPQLKPLEAVRYFDGAPPTWRIVASNVLPRRDSFNKIGIFSPANNVEQCSMQLIRAAGGEGKSTLLMQAAAEAGSHDEWNVIYRPSSQFGLSSEALLKLDGPKKWLLVIDDADNIVESVYECLTALHQANQTNIHFLLAARDADWRSAKGDAKPWSQLCGRYADIVLRGLENEHEALAFVEAWSTFGEQGLRALASLESKQEMATALNASVHNSSENSRKEGSLLGGLLDVRFSPQSLRDHVRDCMTRLGAKLVRGSQQTLLDALVYVATCHAVGIKGINGDVLADLLGVPRVWINTWVVAPLGEEAVGAMSGGQVFIRHRKVAEAIIAEAEINLFIDLAEVWATLIRQTAITGKASKHEVTFGDTMHIAPRLQRLLPRAIPEERRAAIALSAARAAVEAHNDRLDQLVDLGRTYRAADDPLSAIEVFRNGLAQVRTKVDYVEHARGYWYEWSICEGMRLNGLVSAAINAWLGSVGLSDELNPAQLTARDISMGAAGLGGAFRKLITGDPDCVFAFAHRALVYIGLLSVGNNVKTRGYLNIHRSEADRVGTPEPKNLTEAIDWLTNGARATVSLVNDDWLVALVDPAKLRFENLRAVVTPLLK